jgi:hypothetical protein
MDRCVIGPNLVVCGADDRMTSALEYLAASIKRAELPRARCRPHGHDEKLKAVVSVVTGFIKEISYRPGNDAYIVEDC